MGLIMDIQSGKRVRTFGDAIVAWAIIGAGLGIAAALLFSHSDVPIFTLIGGLAGGAVGFYAEWGTSHFAKILALPGVLLLMIR
jgi:hypothetical protein